VRQKSKPQIFAHILTDFHFFHWNILWKMCNKVVAKLKRPNLNRIATLPWQM